MSEVINLQGIDITLYPEEAEDIARYRYRLALEADIAEKKLQDFFKANSSLQKFIDNIPAFYHDTINRLVEFTVNRLVDNGFYHVTIDEYKQKYALNCFSLFEDKIAEMINFDSDTQERLEANKEARRINKENRFQIEVYRSFGGVSNFLADRAKAGVVNKTTGLLHSISNSAGNLIDNISASSQRSQYYKDTNLREELIFLLKESILSLEKPYINYSEYKIYDTTYRNEHYEGLLQNLLEGRIPENAVGKLLPELLATDLTNPFLYDKKLLAMLVPETYDKVLYIAGILDINNSYYTAHKQCVKMGLDTDYYMSKIASYYRRYEDIPETLLCEIAFSILNGVHAIKDEEAGLKLLRSLDRNIPKVRETLATYDAITFCKTYSLEEAFFAPKIKAATMQDDLMPYPLKYELLFCLINGIHSAKNQEMAHKFISDLPDTDSDKPLLLGCYYLLAKGLPPKTFAEGIKLLITNPKQDKLTDLLLASSILKFPLSSIKLLNIAKALFEKYPTEKLSQIHLFKFYKYGLNIENNLPVFDFEEYLSWVFKISLFTDIDKDLLDLANNKDNKTIKWYYHAAQHIDTIIQELLLGESTIAKLIINNKLNTVDVMRIVAKEYLDKAIEQNYKPALLETGVKALKNDNIEQGYKLITELINSPDLEEDIKLNYIKKLDDFFTIPLESLQHLTEDTIPEPKALYISHWEKRAKEGNIDFIRMLIVANKNNIAEQLQWLDLGETYALPDIIYEYGKLLFTDKIPKYSTTHMDMAKVKLQKAFDLGYSLAGLELGLLAEQGIGEEINWYKSVLYYDKYLHCTPEHLGVKLLPPAPDYYLKIGSMLCSGGNGLEANLEQAYVYIAKANSLGVQGASEFLQKHKELKNMHKAALKEAKRQEREAQGNSGFYGSIKKLFS